MFDDYMSNSLKEILTDKKKLMEWHTVFLLIIYYILQWKYRQNKANNFFYAPFPSLNSLINLLPINYKLSLMRVLWQIIFIRETVGKIRADELWKQISIENFVAKSKNSGNAICCCLNIKKKSSWIFFKVKPCFLLVVKVIFGLVKLTRSH